MYQQKISIIRTATSLLLRSPTIDTPKAKETLSRWNRHYLTDVIFSFSSFYASSQNFSSWIYSLLQSPLTSLLSFSYSSFSSFSSLSLHRHCLCPPPTSPSFELFSTLSVVALHPDHRAKRRCHVIEIYMHESLISKSKSLKCLNLRISLFNYESGNKETIITVPSVASCDTWDLRAFYGTAHSEDFPLPPTDILYRQSDVHTAYISSTA